MFCVCFVLGLRLWRCCEDWLTFLHPCAFNVDQYCKFCLISIDHHFISDAPESFWRFMLVNVLLSCLNSNAIIFLLLVKTNKYLPSRQLCAWKFSTWIRHKWRVQAQVQLFLIVSKYYVFSLTSSLKQRYGALTF